VRRFRLHPIQRNKDRARAADSILMSVDTEEIEVAKPPVDRDEVD
jgi:hypothetical protein